MTTPSRRGLFALAGAAVAPMVAKPLAAALPCDWEPITWAAARAAPLPPPAAVQWVPDGYAVTREVLEDNFYAEVTAARVSARVAEVFNRNRMTEGFHAIGDARFEATVVVREPIYVFGESTIERGSWR